MKSFLRWSAIFMLVAIVAPILYAIGTNPLLIFPIYWLIAYFVFRHTFPAGKQTVIPMMAVQTGQLAWLLQLAAHGRWALAFDLQPILLLTGMVWLFVTISRAAAGALAVLQVYALLTGVIAVLRLNLGGLDSGDQVWAWAGAATSLFAHVWAIFLLVVFLTEGRTHEPLADVAAD